MIRTRYFSASWGLYKHTSDVESVLIHHAISYSAPVAQLDRVPGYEPGGREFESLRARHQIKNLRGAQCSVALFGTKMLPLATIITAATFSPASSGDSTLSRRTQSRTSWLLRWVVVEVFHVRTPFFCDRSRMDPRSVSHLPMQAGNLSDHRRKTDRGRDRKQRHPIRPVIWARPDAKGESDDHDGEHAEVEERDRQPQTSSARKCPLQIVRPNVSGRGVNPRQELGVVILHVAEVLRPQILTPYRG
jgi:hypothetical protein